MWSSGKPSDEDVWESLAYQEIAYDFEGEMIIDARGELASGQLWRNLGRAGESAFYSGVDEPTAKLLDKFLDGACAQPMKFDRTSK